MGDAEADANEDTESAREEAIRAFKADWFQERLRDAAGRGARLEVIALITLHNEWAGSMAVHQPDHTQLEKEATVDGLGGSMRPVSPRGRGVWSTKLKVKKPEGPIDLDSENYANGVHVEGGET